MTDLLTKIIRAAKPEEGYISFDVFDTLITRQVVPETVLRGIARYIFWILDIESKEENVDISLDLRGKAWNQLLESKRLIDPSIEDGLSREMIPIWIQLVKEYFNSEVELDIEQLTGISRMEINLEKIVLIPIIENLNLVKKLKNLGYRLIFVSDMYLSSQEILELLEHTGYKDIFELAISSGELGLLKRTGNLFKKLSEQGISIQLHIGDDVLADKNKPIENGIVGFHFISNELISHKRNASKLSKSILQGTHSKAALLNEFTSQKLQKEMIFVDSFVQSMANFILALAQVKRLYQYPTILPSREGLLLGSALHELHDVFGNMKLLYAPFSRASLAPILHSGSPKDFLKILIEDNPDMTWLDICTFLEIPHSDGVEIALKNGMSNFNSKIEILEVSETLTRIARDKNFKFFWSLQIEKKEIALKEWINKNITFFRELNFVDLGWNGTIQSNLAAGLAEESVITGYYFGLSSRSQQYISPNSYLFSLVAFQNQDFASQVILDLPQLLEIKIQAPHHSIDKILSEEPSISLIEKYLEQNLTEYDRITEHKNVLRYCNILKVAHWMFVPKFSDYCNYSGTAAASYILFPTLESIKSVSHFQATRGFKSRKTYEIVGRVQGIKDIRKSYWKVASSFLLGGRFFSLCVLLRHQLRWNLTKREFPLIRQSKETISNIEEHACSQIFIDYIDLLGNLEYKSSLSFKTKPISVRLLMTLSNSVRYLTRGSRFKNYTVHTRAEIKRLVRG